MNTISFNGLASGLDTAAIVDALVGVQRVPVQRLQVANSNNNAKIGIVDKLSAALANLRTKATELDTRGEFLSFKGSVSDTSVAKVTTSGDAIPGQYEMVVSRLATAQRTYADPIADKTAALSTTEETLSFTIDGTTTDITVPAGSSLEGVANAINSAGVDASAGIMFDGTNYRLQVVGDDTGTDAAITFADSGLGLGLETPANTVQAAGNAEFTLDGFAISSATNVVDGVLPGATLELTGETAVDTPVTLTIASDSEGVKTKLDAFVSAYNEVFKIINAQIGQGKGADTLNGDASVRSIETGLSRLVSSPIPGLTTANGDTLQLSDLGIKTGRDGTLTLDGAVLTEKLASGFVDAARIFAGDTASGTPGLGKLMDSLVDGYTDSVDGLLSARKQGLQNLIKINDERITSLETYIESYQTSLEAQFTQLESLMSSLQSQQSYLASFLQG